MTLVYTCIYTVCYNSFSVWNELVLNGILGWWVKPLHSFAQFYPGQLGKTWVKLGKR